MSATTPDPDASNNTATAQTAVNRDADVRVVKSVSPATVLVGEQATFTVTVSNAGPARALGLVVHDLLPGGLTLDSSTPSQGSYVPATGNWTVGALDAGQSATLTLVADAGGDRRGHEPRDDHRRRTSPIPTRATTRRRPK